MNIGERIKMVKCMEFIVRHINNEIIAVPWLANGVADGDIAIGDLDADYDSKMDGYIGDDEIADLMRMFLNRMKYAGRSGGLYCDGVASSRGVNL